MTNIREKTQGELHTHTITRNDKTNIVEYENSLPMGYVIKRETDGGLGFYWVIQRLNHNKKSDRFLLSNKTFEKIDKLIKQDEKNKI